MLNVLLVYEHAMRPQDSCYLLEGSRNVPEDPRNDLTGRLIEGRVRSARVKIPRAGISQVFGLLDVVRAYGGKTDIAHLNLDFHLDLDELLPIIDTAVMVGLVTVREGDISLTDLGKKLLTSKMEARKRLIGEQLAKTELYSELLKVLSIRTNLTRATLAKVTEAKTGPQSDIDDIVSFVIRWGVFAGLFNYDGGKGKVVAKIAAQA